MELPSMDRATQRRALRAAGYRGSKSRRNRLTREQATEVVTVMRNVAAQLPEEGESDLL